MRGSSYSQKSQSLQVSGARSSMRVQSPSPSRCRGSSYNNRGRSGYQDGHVSSAVELGTEIHQVHANEKEEMQELNVRFAGYIEKVQALEQRNALLMAELAALQGRFKGGPTGIGEEYNLKFKEMRELIEALTNEKGAADIERGYIEEEVEVWRMKLEEELALKEEAEMILREFRQDVDNATLQKAELEKSVEQLVAEIEFLKKLHDEEVADLMKQIEDSKVTTELDGDRPDLAAYLRNMRAEIETVAAKNVQEAEKWYKGKFETLKEVAGKKEEQMKSMKEEITTFHNQVTDLQNQIDGLRARNAALEQQLEDMEMAHMDKVGGLEGIIAQLEHQLCETKMEMGKYLADYQELLHIKLKLDAEIAVYRKLLEGEEKYVAPLYTFTPTPPSAAPGPALHELAPKMPEQTSSVLDVTTTAAAQIAPPVTASVPHPLSAPVALVTVTPAATQPTLRIAPVVIHRKSPSPRFKATEAALKAPKSMFDVPQIRVYTASMSPLHDYTGSKTSTADALSLSITPTSEITRAFTPTAEIKRSATPTSGVKRGLTPTPGLQRSATPTSEVKRAKTPTHDFLTPRTPLGRPKTPSFHVSRAKTPVFEISRTNPLLFAVSPITTEAQISNTPTPGTNAACQSLSDPSKSSSTILGARTLNGEETSKETPTAKSPPQNTSKPEAPRHENPVVESARPKTPTDLLGYQRPKTPTGVAPTFGYQRPKTPTDITPKSAAPSYGYQRPKTPTIVTLKPTAPTDGYQRPKTPTKETSKPTAPSDGYPRPKTPTNEGHKPMTPTIEYQKPQPPAGYQRPKTPTAGVSSIGFQRPKTPTYVDPKPSHTYYGLTPAAYVAHGGIQSFSPLFGISRSKTPTQEESKTQELEASKTPTQELPVKSYPLPEVSNQEAPFKELEKTISSEAIVSMTVVKLPLPTIVVTQAEEVSETRVSTAVTSKISTPIAEMPKVKTVANTRPWAKSPTPEVKTPVKTPTYGVYPKPKTPTPETQRKTIPPFSKTESPVAKASVVQQKELKESTEPKMPTKATSEAKPVGTKPTNSSPLAKTASPENLLLPAKPKNNQEAKPEKVVSAPTTPLTEKKEERKDSFPAAEPLLKVIQKPKGMMKSKLSGWSRLKKHMVVEEEPPMFTESDPKKETAKVTEQEGGEVKKDEKVLFKDMVAAVTADDPPKAAKKWDSLLFDMFSTKEKIMQVIEASKSEEERKEQPKDAGKEIPSFAHRLPVLLFSPKFDAKRLREAASRPLTKISTVFEMGLIGRKNKDEEPKDFNRTARGFTCP